MTSLTDTQVVTASGGLVELGYAEKTSNSTITSTSAASPTATGISVTVVSDGSPLDVEFYCGEATPPNTNNGVLLAALWVDGAEYDRTMGVAYNYSDGVNSGRTLYAKKRITLSAGSHTIDIRGWLANNAGLSGYFFAGTSLSGYSPTFLRVSKIVQATQWPAVTTGTIICTSSTRPASPFEGQMVYETDTGLTRYYDGSSWEDTARATRPYHAEVYLASNISYPRATNLQWTHLREDNTGGAWAASPNPERLVFPADGMYLCVANMRWDVGTGNDSTQTGMTVNGGLGSVSNVGYAVNGTSVQEILTSVAVVSAGDYLTVSCFNKPSGGSPFTAVAGSWMSFTQLSAVPT